MNIIYEDRMSAIGKGVNNLWIFMRVLWLSIMLLLCHTLSYAMNTDGMDLKFAWDAEGVKQNHFIVEIQRSCIDSEDDSVWVEKDYTNNPEYIFSVENGFQYTIHIQEVNHYGVTSDNSEKLSFDVQNNEIVYHDNNSNNPLSTITLSSNYPNPFNPITTISYILSHDDHVKLCIYNVVGQEVIRLVEDYMPAGTYHAKWLADQMPSGIYFYKLETSNSTETRKMLLLK